MDSPEKSVLSEKMAGTVFSPSSGDHSGKEMPFP
jgi:hypothetical protein